MVTCSTIVTPSDKHCSPMYWAKMLGFRACGALECWADSESSTPAAIAERPRTPGVRGRLPVWRVQLWLILPAFAPLVVAANVPPVAWTRSPA